MRRQLFLWGSLQTKSTRQGLQRRLEKSLDGMQVAAPLEAAGRGAALGESAGGYYRPQCCSNRQRRTSTVCPGWSSKNRSNYGGKRKKTLKKLAQLPITAEVDVPFRFLDGDVGRIEEEVEEVNKSPELKRSFGDDGRDLRTVEADRPANVAIPAGEFECLDNQAKIFLNPHSKVKESVVATTTTTPTAEVPSPLSPTTLKRCQ